MRLRLLPALLLLGWLPRAAAAAPAGELLANPDFSAATDGRLADHWHDASTALPQPADFSRVTYGPAGRPVQRVTVRALDGGRCRLEQTITPPAPGLYRLRVAVRAAYPAEVELALRTSPRPWIVFGSVREDLPAGGWREVVGYARVPPAPGPLDFVIAIDDPSTVDLGSASLRAVDETSLSAAERAQVEATLGPPLPPLSVAQLVAGTDARILATRTAPLAVHVVDQSGKPVAGLVVHVEDQRHLFWFGAGFRWEWMPREGETVVDRYHREAFLRLFNAATVPVYAENYEPAPGYYRDDTLLRALDWLSAHGLRANASPFYWNLSSPPWLAAAAPTVGRLREWMDRLLAHASNTYLSRVACVELFNEVTAWDRFRAPLTPVLAGPQKAAVIADYLRRCKALNPTTQLMVNDYDSTPAYYHLLRQIIDAGGALDDIGLQTHMQNGNWSVVQLWNVLNRLALLQRPIYLTELSVISGTPRDFNFRPANPPWETTAAGEAAQARYLGLFYRLAYSHPAVAGITYWDLSDRSAWLGCPVGLLRKDGTPKPAYWVLDRLINQAWRTNGDFRTDPSGRVLIPHAFEGHYRITAGGITVSRDHSPAQPLDAVIVVPS